MKARLAILAAALGAAGCSSESTPTPPPKTVLTAPPSVTPVPQATPNMKRAATKKTEPEAAPSVPVIPDGALFVGGNQPNFTLLSFADARPEDRFVVVSPPIGLDSQFVTVEVDPPQPPSAAIQALPDGFTEIESAGYDETGWPLRIRCDIDGSVLAFVPAGPFLQGIDGGDPNAGPRHAIELDAYYIDTHEITVEQFQKYRDALKAEKKISPPPAANASSPATHPALGVSWKDAMMYARWAGKQLPSEAEWEKAARGVQGFAYPWGSTRPIFERHRTFSQIDPVGSFRSDESPFGVFDVAGNAREWCQDWYADDAYQQFASTAGVAIKNWPGPKSPDRQSRRVVRGSIVRWEVWARDGVPMKDAPKDVGFRCVRRLQAGLDSEAASDADETVVAEPGNPNAPPRGGSPSAPPRGGVPGQKDRNKPPQKQPPRGGTPAPGF